jgi:hypothetical protein
MGDHEANPQGTRIPSVRIAALLKPLAATATTFAALAGTLVSPYGFRPQATTWPRAAMTGSKKSRPEKIASETLAESLRKTFVMR